jgi:hypothetical protein
MFTATASEMVEIDHPNSWCSGSISTPGTARKPAAPTRARKVTAATHHAGWIRGRRAQLSSLTQLSLADRRRQHQLSDERHTGYRGPHRTRLGHWNP